MFKSIGTHWIALYSNDIIYSDSFGVKHIPKEIKQFIGNKNIITNTYKIQAYNSIMCGFFCFGFINFMLKGKSLLDCKNLFPLNNYEKNDNITLKYSQKLKRWKNYTA